MEEADARSRAVNGKLNPPWRISMTPVGDGNFRLYLHDAVRKMSATRVGDHVEISASFDKGYRGGLMHEMPPVFVGRLSSEPKAQAAWNKLPLAGKKKSFGILRL